MVENNPNATCFFCGSKNTHASWIGDSGSIDICSNCATNTLPKLIGDAVYGGLPQNVKSKESNKSAVQYVEEKSRLIRANYFETIAKASLHEAHSLSAEEVEKRGQEIMKEMGIKVK